jgi:hypothetical protein
MTEFDKIMHEIDRGKKGMNSSVPMGFDRLNRYVSIRKRIYTLVFGPTGCGKSAFVHNAFILNPFEWSLKHKGKTDVKVKVILFSMERSKLYTLSKWLSRKIFIEENFLIPIPKMLGWWDTKISFDEHDIIKKYEDYINELCEFCDIIEGAQNPTGIYKYVKNYATSNGKEEPISEFKKIYLPNNENELVIPIVDHLGLVKPEKGQNSKKEAIDKTSEYFQIFRDLYGYSPVAVSQINRDISNPIYKKMDSFEPNLDQVKESGRPSEDSDCVLSLFQPSRFKTTDPGYQVEKFINQETGGDFFRKTLILKNTYGESDIGIGMAFHGATGTFVELPKAKAMENFDYDSVFSGEYFLYELSKNLR